MTPRRPLLQMLDIEKTYRRGPEVVHAVGGVTMTIEAGEIVALVGPSGSGKTTLLNLVAGWEEPDSGEILWRGSVVDPATLQWADVAIVPQGLGLLDDLTIAENVHFPLRLGGSDGAASTILEDLDIRALKDRLPREVSLGEQQRAAVARAMIARPRLLLADEPTAHQDHRSLRRTLRVIRDACESGMACLVATHNPEVLRDVDRILHLRDRSAREEQGPMLHV